MVGSDDEDDILDNLPAVGNAAHADAQPHGQDDMPALVTSDDSASDSVPDLESDGGDDEDVFLDHDSDYEDSLSDEDDSNDEELPPLVDILPRGFDTASFTNLGDPGHSHPITLEQLDEMIHLGSNQPLTLDQLDAVDQLSHVMEESADVAASGNLVSLVYLTFLLLTLHFDPFATCVQLILDAPECYRLSSWDASKGFCEMVHDFYA